MTIWAGSDFGPWVRGGLAAFFFGKAALSGFQLLGIVKGESAIVSFARGYRALAVGYVTAGCIIGVGALLQRSFFGFLVAYGAFSFAWFWFWITRQLMPPKRDH